MDVMDRRTGLAATLAGRRAVEKAMIDEYAERTGRGPLTTQWVRLADVSGVQIEGVNEAGDLFVVATATAGPVGAAEAPHLARDVFSLSLVLRHRPGSRAVLLYAGAAAAESAAPMVRRLAGDQVIEIDVVEPSAC